MGTALSPMTYLKHQSETAELLKTLGNDELQVCLMKGENLGVYEAVQYALSFLTVT